MKALVLICATALSSLLLAGSVHAQPAATPPAATTPAAAPATTEPAAAAAPDPAAAAAAPTASPTAAAEPAAAQPASPGGPAAAGATPIGLKHTCMDAINSDQQWTDELTAIIEKRVRFKVHNEEAELIAMNKQHVVMAYAVMWLLAVAFLFAQWRRQQALKKQIEALQSELQAAIKGPAT
jgi:hypothetical protein